MHTHHYQNAAGLILLVSRKLPDLNAAALLAAVRESGSRNRTMIHARDKAVRV